MSASSSAKRTWIWIIAVAVIVIFVWVTLADMNDDDGGSGGAVFGAADSARLSDRLAAAQRAQGVCYGWRVDPGTPGRSFTAAPDGTETGSSLGPRTDPAQDKVRCARYAVVDARYSYSSIDEEWTSVSLHVDNNLGLNPTSTTLLSRVGLTERDLLDDEAAGRLADVVGALPLLAAEEGKAPPVPLDAASTPRAGDRISGSGHGRTVFIGLGAALILGGVIWIIVAAARRNST
ncbi:hypothetical protein [Actinomadura flavalba]|uniref:hypothetical protein n=1 Tax=Actinomadura flavalba TaxID=1120938 RepID=UPI000361BBC1|nr:hypothetical protein [Actinomadura flavalba]